MKNKIIYSTIVCLWALMTSLSAQNIGLSFPDTTMVLGDTIVLPLYVDSTLTGEEVYSFNLDVRFPSSYFTFVELSTSDMLLDFGDVIVNSTQAGKVLISGASGTALAGTGVLLYIRFKAIRTHYAGEISIYSSSIFNEGVPAIISESGRVEIQTGPVIIIYPNDANLLVGESQEFYVYKDTVAPFRYFVLNPLVGSVSNDGLFIALASGQTKVEVRDSNNTVDATNSNINVFDFSLSSPTDLTEWQGGQIDVPVIIHNPAGIDFISGSFIFQYADRILTFKELVDSTTLLENTSVEYVEVASNKLKVNFASGQTLGTDSVLIYLRFDISPTITGTSNFEYSDIVFNENVMGLNRMGRFGTINFQTVNIYSSKYSLIAGEVWPLNVSGGILPYAFLSNNENAASISEDGKITAVRGGMVTFTAADSVGSAKESNEFTVYDTYVEIADTTGPLLTDYLLPVYMGDLPSGISVNAFQMEISFKQAELEFLSIVSTNSLTEGWSLAHSLTANRLMVSGAGTNELTERGVLFYVKYRFTADFTLNERVYVTIDKVMLNEGSPTALDRDGSIVCVKREDLMVTELLSPLSDCELTAEEEVSIEIRNNGFVDYQKGDTLMVSYTFSGSTEVIDTIILDREFPMKSEMQYTFASTVNMLQNGRYYLMVQTKLSAELDGNMANDKISQYITNYTDPSLNLGEDIIICSQEPILIEAPEDYVTYEWSTGAVDTNAVFVDTTSTVWLKVTNSYGCVIIDTIEIEIYDIPSAPEMLYSRTQACVGDSIRLEAPAGFAQYRWTSGQTDSIIYAFTTGDYGVWVYNEGMCESDTSELVSLMFNTSPVADFSYTNEGLRVAFTNLSTSASSYRWYFGDGNSSEEVNPVHTYAWRDSDYVSLKSIPDDYELFRYYVRLVSSNGDCNDYYWDTIPSSAFLANTIDETICEGDVYEFGEELLSESGIYYHNFQHPTGEDSIVQLNLKVTPVYDDTLEIDICGYEDYEFDDRFLTEAGIYTDSSFSIGGCDSITTLILVVMPNRDDSISATICDGAFYVFGSDTLRIPGVYALDGLTQGPVVAAPEPCMRTVLTLSVEPAGDVADTLMICANELPFDYNGYIFPIGTTSGEKNIYFESPYGCITEFVLDLTVITGSTTDVIDYGEICPMEMVNGRARIDENYDTLTYKNKCDYDSIVIHRWDMIYPPIIDIQGAISAVLNNPTVYTVDAIANYVEWFVQDTSAVLNFLSDSTVEITFNKIKVYEVYIGVFNQCGQYFDTLSIVVDSTAMGLPAVAIKGDVEVYPNPAQDVVQFNSRYEMSTISIFNGLGNEIFIQNVSGQQVDLYLGDVCSSGIYFAKVVTQGKGVFILKIIIE